MENSDSEASKTRSKKDLINSVLIPAAISKAGTDINFSGIEDFEDIYVQHSLRQQVLEIQQELDIKSLAASPKKKRKRYYIPVKFFPRILKSDIRRDYAKMMVNVFNSGNDSMMRNFLNTYGIPDCQFVRLSFQGVVFNAPVTEYVEGIDNIVPVFCRQIRTFPDLAVKLDKSAIIPNMNKDEGSKVVFFTTVNFTKLFQGISLMDLKQLMANQMQPKDTAAFQYSGNIPLPDSSGKPMEWKSWIVPHSTSEVDASLTAKNELSKPLSVSEPLTANTQTLSAELPPVPLSLPSTSSSSSVSSSSSPPPLSPGAVPIASSSASDTSNNLHIMTNKMQQIIQLMGQQKLLSSSSSLPTRTAASPLPLSKPLELSRSCRVIFCLDERNRLYRIEVYPLPPSVSTS